MSVVVPIGKNCPDVTTTLFASRHSMVGEGSHVSCAARVKLTGAPLGVVHSTGPMFPGHTVKTGGVVSTTVTVKVHVLVLGGVAWSLAVHVTVVAPSGKVVPESGAQLTVGAGSHASDAVGVANVATAPAALVHSAVIAAGQVIDGAVVSLTVTVNEQVRVFGAVAWSLAVHVTVVVPMGNVVPEAGAQLTVGVGSHVSVAAGVA